MSVIFTRVGAVSFTLNVSSGSTAVSPLIGTVIVAVVAPAGIDLTTFVCLT